MTEFEPESDSATGQHLLEANQCALNYFDWFEILMTAHSQFYSHLLEAIYISYKKRIGAEKSSLYSSFY